LEAWDEFKKNVDFNIWGFPIWVDYFKVKPSPDQPGWKKDIIKKNNLMYWYNQKFIDQWIVENNVMNWTPTKRKFEWQAGTDIKSLWEGIIQIRTSGVRVKRPTEAPALVAIVHVPIYGPLRRRITPKEMANLQSFDKKFKVDKTDQQAYKQFGNSINTLIARELIRSLLND